MDGKIQALFEESIWEGPLRNFVIQGEGIKQEGRNRLTVRKLAKGHIEIRNTFIRKDGTPTDYEGVTEMKLQGDRLICPREEEVDPNTNNPIKNRLFSGYTLPNHLYMLEEYEEVHEGKRVEKRRNELHYYFLNNREIINLVSVYVDGDLLVYGHSHLKKEESTI